MVEGKPDVSRFRRVMARTLKKASAGGQHVRVFGEMVALLWMDDQQQAALRLEELWNELRERVVPFTLLCAYPLTLFARGADVLPFAEICQRHALVLPDGRYSALSLPAERLREVTVLQQKARAFAAEIEERRLAELAARESAERWRALAESLPQLLFTALPNGYVEYVNRQWIAYTGFDAAALQTGGWQQLVHPEDLHDFLTAWQQALHTGAVMVGEYRLRKHDEEYRWHVCQVVPVATAASDASLWISTFTDIHEQKVFSPTSTSKKCWRSGKMPSSAWQAMNSKRPLPV